MGIEMTEMPLWMMVQSVNHTPAFAGSGMLRYLSSKPENI